MNKIFKIYEYCITFLNKILVKPYYILNILRNFVHSVLEKLLSQLLILNFDKFI